MARLAAGPVSDSSEEAEPPQPEFGGGTGEEGELEEPSQPRVDDPQPYISGAQWPTWVVRQDGQPSLGWPYNSLHGRYPKGTTRSWAKR